MVDFSIDDTDVYVEKPEKEYSQQENINKLIEWKRCNTRTAVSNLQKGLIPQFLDLTWNKTDTYFKDNAYVVSRDYFETCIHVNGIVNNIFLNEDGGRFFYTKMKDGYDNGILQPFLLFVNKVHIAWSRITIVRSDFNISLLISDMDKDIPVTDVQILSIPFQIIYGEDEDELADKRTMFRFRKDGTYGYGSSIFVYPEDDNTQTYSFSENSYVNFDMNISYKVLLNRDNIIAFNSIGELDKDLVIDIKNNNLLTTSQPNTKYYLCCIYSSLSNLNESNNTRGLNERFEKEIINGSSGDVRNLILDKFDFTHIKSLDYPSNISNSLNYVFREDENKLDKIFEDNKQVNIIEYDISALDKRYLVNNTLTMLKDVYSGDDSESFPIFFHNGMVPSYYKDTVYDQNSFNIQLPNGSTGTFEIVYFRNINNTLIKLDLSHKADSDYLNIKDCGIPREDLIVYSACRGEQNLFPINYSIDANSNIVLSNPRYLEAQLYLGSRRQMLYENYSIPTNTNMLELSTKFRTGFNGSKYMVFVNGKLINSAFYRVLVPSLNNSSITKRAIYTMRTFKAGDRVDVFYVGPTITNKVRVSQDLLTHCIKVNANTTGQTRFRVPYPFANYPRNIDSFFCIKGSTYIDKARYILDGEDIIFTDGMHIEAGLELLFLFPCFKSIWDDNGVVNTNVSLLNREKIKFQEVEVPITYTGQGTFAIPYPFPNYKDMKFFITMGSTFFGDDRYVVSGDNIIINSGEVLKAGRIMKFTFVHNSGFSLIEKKQIHVEVPANQTVVDIPTPFNRIVNLSNRMTLTRGTMYLDRERYSIDDKNLKVTLSSPLSTSITRTLTFTFFYIGGIDNGACAYLSKSGYICLDNIDRNFNKELCMVFVNGKKVAKSELLDISNNLLKVKKDIQRRYDLTVIGCSPLISELKSMYPTKSTWNTTTENLNDI